MFRGRKGVSEVVASLILLLIVSILGTYLYSYTLTVTGSQIDSMQGEIKLDTEKAQERFKIISVIWSGSGEILNITVLNCGGLDLKIVDVYVNSEKTSTFYMGRGVVIYTSNLRRISFTSPVSITSNGQYEIIAVSERGNSVVLNWRP